MSLTEKKIVSNTAKYFETTKNLGVMPDELKTFLGGDFAKSASSNNPKLGNAFEGGLIEYLLRVAFYAVRANNSLADEDKVNQDSLLKVCLLHNIGKANELKAESSISSVELSLRYLTQHGVQLTDEEYIAILLSNKFDEHSLVNNSTLGELLKFGIAFANKQGSK